jgi:hypothetical protein
MKAFQFDARLFGERTKAQDALTRAGYFWFEHYSAIDVMHDLLGLEVCGISKETDARKILSVLQKAFPLWHYHNIFLRDVGSCDLGWQVSIHQAAEVAADF